MAITLKESGNGLLVISDPNAMKCNDNGGDYDSNDMTTTTVTW